jgi:hypothetical protein
MRISHLRLPNVRQKTIVDKQRGPSVNIIIMDYASVQQIATRLADAAVLAYFLMQAIYDSLPYAAIYPDFHGSGSEPCPVCTENSVRIDLVAESPNVSDDGRAVMLLACAVHPAVQVEEPARRRTLRSGISWLCCGGRCRSHDISAGGDAAWQADFRHLRRRALIPPAGEADYRYTARKTAKPRRY